MVVQKQLIRQEMKILEGTMKQQSGQLNKLNGILRQLQMSKKATGSTAFDNQIQQVTVAIGSLNSQIQTNMMRYNMLQGKLAQLNALDP